MKIQKIINIRKDLNFSEILNNDNNNIANHYNTHRYRQVLEGNISSPALEYLLNMGQMGIADYKTLDYFNKNAIALKEMALSELNEINDDKTIKLVTKFRKNKVDLIELLNHRKSVRRFSPISLKFKLFSELLAVLCDMDRKKIFNDLSVPARGYGSGGGLYPIEVFLLINDVEGVKKGFYKLQPHTHTIRWVHCVSDDVYQNIIPGENIDVISSSFVIFYCLDITKIYPKYGEEFLELSLKEVGEMSQLIDIQVAALALASCQSAGYNKKILKKSLQIDEITKRVVHAQVIGVI